MELIEPVAWQRCEVVNKAEQESLRTVLEQWGLPMTRGIAIARWSDQVKADIRLRAIDFTVANQLRSERAPTSSPGPAPC